MSFRQKHDSGNRAVAWMATCFVVLGGAVSCMAIAAAGDPEHLESAVVPVAGILVVTIALLWLFRYRTPESRLWNNWNWMISRGKRRVAYHLKPKLSRHERVPHPPAPPTVESVREITGGQNTWVPTSTVRRRTP